MLGCIMTYILVGVFAIANNAECATAAVRLSSHQVLAFAKFVSACVHYQAADFFLLLPWGLFNFVFL